MKPLRIALAADLHFYPAELAGGYNQAFRDDNYDLGKPAEQSEALVHAALATLKLKAKKEGLDALVIAGDLTRNGEYDAHVRLAALLVKFQRESGVRVLVVPGNHDLNNPDAAEYTTGERLSARGTTPAEFLELYKALRPRGARYCPSNPLSYAVDLGRDYRLIAVDTCKYDENGHSLISGAVDPEHLKWILNECAKARRAGKIILGAMHHNLAEQVGYQAAVFKGYLLDDHIRVREALADAGMRFHFCGHTHRGNVAGCTSDSGSLLYDICAPALYAFPCELTGITFTRAGKKVTAHLKSFPASEAVSPRESYRFTFCGSQGGGLTGFFQANIRLRLTPILEEIAQAGGLKLWLEEKNGVQRNSALRTALLAQLDERYINNPEHAVELFCRILGDAMNRPVSELPARQFVDTLGVGHKKRPGTWSDFMETAVALVYWQGDFEGDPFLQDLLESMRSGRFVDETLRFAVDKIVDDLLLKELLPQLKLRLGTKSGRRAKLALQAAFGLLIDIRRRRAVSKTLTWLMLEFLGKPRERELTLTHRGRVTVRATPSEFRRPAQLEVALNDTKTGATITWYTKESVTAGDVIICDREMRPVRGLRVSQSAVPAPFVARKLDIGVTKILGHEIPATRHTVVIEGLAPGRYILRAGDKSRRWLSPWVALNTEQQTKSARVFKGTAFTAGKIMSLFRLVEGRIP